MWSGREQVVRKGYHWGFDVIMVVVVVVVVLGIL